jgi:hypothetical protein
MLRRFIGGKRTIAVFVVACAALAVGVSVAVAKSGPSQVKVHFQVSQFAGFPGLPGSLCLDPLTKKEVGKGKVWIDEKGGPLNIVAQFRGIDSGKYELFIEDVGKTPPITCGTVFVADVGSFSVGDDGETCNTSFPAFVPPIPPFGPSDHCGEGTVKASVDTTGFPVKQSFALFAVNFDTGTTIVVSNTFKLGGL